MYRYPDNFIKLYEKSFRRNAELPALSLYGEQGTMSYLRLAANIARAHILFQNLGLRRGDRVALYAKDSDVWVEAFMAVITYGATVVPVLPDFTPEDATNILNHCEAKLLLAGDQLFDKLDFKKLKHVEAVLSLIKPGMLAAKDPAKVVRLLERLGDDFQKMYPQGFTADDIHYRQVDNNSVIVLNYTSGTTGFSKGVMLTGWNLAGNVVFGLRSGLHFTRSRVLTFLPLAHAYGCAFDMLTPLAAGSHITVLGRTPSPAVLLGAFAEVKPHLILCVPLVLEKIYRKRILPAMSEPKVRRMLAMPGLRHLVYRKLRARLTAALGGCFKEVVVGGAALSTEVEEFLHSIKFPFTVGYGMTECGPLISYTTPRQFIPTSVGRTLPEIMETRIDSTDPQNIPGMPFVAESLVVDRGGKITALIYPDAEALESRNIPADKVELLMEKIRAKVNSRLAPYERIAAVEIMKEEFKKTPKRSIKRYMYI